MKFENSMQTYKLYGFLRNCTNAAAVNYMDNLSKKYDKDNSIASILRDF